MNPFDLEILNQVKERLISLGGTAVLIPHINPDGDAVGSSLGLARVLKNAGKKVSVISPNKYPDYLSWMEGNDEVLFYTFHRKKSDELIDKAELLVCLDFNQLSRAGKMDIKIRDFKGTVILIDHHPNPDSFAQLMISHPEYSSTAELLYQLMTKTGLSKFVDTEAAEALFCGIMTDTGSFDYNVSDPGTFKAVSELLSYGIDQEKVHSMVYRNYSADRMRLMGFCLNECLEVFPEYHSAMMHISLKTKEKFNFASGDSEDFVNLALSIKGIHFSTLFIENMDHVKVSLRSRGEFPVNELAKTHFNGGGHRNAAGGEINAPLNETLDRFRSILRVYKDKLIRTKTDF